MGKMGAALMGREAEAHISFAGNSGFGKILLESDRIVLRGVVRAQILRTQISGYGAAGDDLLLQTSQGPLRVNLGAAQVVLWLKALAKPLPSLAQKLGISATSPVCVIGPLSDAALIAAIAGATHMQSRLILAELPDQACFDRAFDHLQTQSNPVFWGVTRKGKSSFPEAALRAQMRAAGYIDNKSCAVSDLHTATRFGRKT
jgi:hypothetical protein